MAIDTSMYQTIQPVQAPDVGAAMQRGMTLSNLALQNQNAQLANQQAQYQMQQQRALRNAYATNVGSDGKLNRQGVLSDLYLSGNGDAAMGFVKQATEMDKAQADAQKSQMEAAHATLSITTPAIGHVLFNTPPDQRPQVWNQVRQQLVQQGVDPSKLPQQYDEGLFKLAYANGSQLKEQLDNQLTKTNIGKGQAETGKIYSEIGEVGDKRLQALKEDLDPNKARGGNLAKNQSVVNAADRLNAMFKQFPDYNIPKAQQAELVSAFGSLLNGGSAPFVSQLEELVPKSAQGDANAMASWIMNQPMGADQQKFMQMLHDSVNRERDVADTQVKTAQVQRLSAHELLRKTNPQAYAEVLHGYGIEPKNIVNGKYVPEDQQEDSVPGKQVAQGKKSSDLISSANAGEGNGGISASDAQALQWLKTADKSDPVAFKVRSKLRSKGLIK